MHCGLTQRLLPPRQKHSSQGTAEAIAEPAEYSTPDSMQPRDVDGVSCSIRALALFSSVLTDSGQCSSTQHRFFRSLV